MTSAQAKGGRNWIDDLDEHGFNVIVDELCWRLRAGRFPVSLTKRSRPNTGVEFDFGGYERDFMPVTPDFLSAHWGEAAELIRTVPELDPVLIHEKE
jgi:hypothetical protein